MVRCHVVRKWCSGASIPVCVSPEPVLAGCRHRSTEGHGSGLGGETQGGSDQLARPSV